MATMNIYILLSFLLIISFSLETVSEIIGLTSTRCNVDLSRGPIHDPCGTLHNATCDGDWCKCPPGWKENASNLQCENGGGTLKFHGEKKELGVNETVCTLTHTCDTMFNAVCKNGFCVCDKGVIDKFGKCSSGFWMERTVHSRRSDAKLFSSNAFHTAMIVLTAIAGNHY